MMIKKCYWLLLLLISGAFFSCEKDITVNLPKVDNELVVDGSIENGQLPVIVLTHSLNYFSSIDPVTLENSFVHNANITVTVDGKTHTLKEYAIDTIAALKFYEYSADTTDGKNGFRGEVGKTYDLQIRVAGKTYTSSTTIPKITLTLDSLFYEGVNSGKPEDSDKVILYGVITDPAGSKDYARYFTKENYQPFYPGYNSVFDDQLTNGTIYSIGIDRGFNKNETVDYNEYGYFYKGDSIIVKLCNIDKATYDFWRTWEYAFASIGNPFSSPVKILSNVNGALGYWGGYACQFKTIIIDK